MAQSTHNPFVICKAAAGSGKTFTLVREYLKLAMDVEHAAVRRDTAAWERALRQQFTRILAITFTNKAAGEMKTRVMDYLEQMAAAGTGPARSGMGAALLEVLNGLPCYADAPLTDADLRWMASVVHSAILHRYSDLSVCTIDSFMHRIVRTFAHDLDRPVNFEVMTETDELLEQAVGNLMALVGTPGHEELTRMLQAYADSNMEEGRTFQVEGSLKNLGKQLFTEDADVRLEALRGLTAADYMAIQRELTGLNRRFEQQLRDCGQRMMDALAAIGVNDIDCANGARGYYGFFRKVAEGERRDPLTASVAKAFEEGRLASAKCPAATRQALESALPDLTDIYLELRALVGVASGAEDGEGEPLRLYNSRRLLLSNLYDMALLGALADQMSRFSRENEVMHLSEFNRMIAAVVAEQPAPFIYERLGNRYRHFLIDEFQDTSVLQWHNLVPLLENGVSQRRESLVVGDGKQSIYRFRGGDVRQFAELPHVSGMELHGATLEARGNYSVQPLATNYRTARCVVEFNNALFEWLAMHQPFAGNPLVQRIYVGERDADNRPELYQHLPDGRKQRGRVDVHFTPKDDDEAVYEYIRQTIVRLVTQQGYRMSDIMVLGRENRDLENVSTYLQTHTEGMRIDVTSSESFFLVRSHAVMAVVAALRLLYNPSDRVAAADLMQRLYSLELVASPHADAFLADGDIDVAALLRAEGRGMELRFEYLAALDLYDCCEEIVRSLHLDGIDVPYVGSLLGRVAEFAARRHAGVGDFLDWLDDNATPDFTSLRRRQLSAASPEGIDAVRLLTIHKAKGLEAPVVIVPLINHQKKDFALWVDVERHMKMEGVQLPVAYVKMGRKASTCFDMERDTESMMDQVDQLNVLYVALTRPREQLVVVAPEPSENSSLQVNFPLMLKQFVEECSPDLGDADCRREDSDASAADTALQTPLHRISFADWTAKVQVAAPSEHALDTLVEERIRFGNCWHDLMAMVRHADDVDTALERFAKREAVDDGWLDRLALMAHRVVRHPDCERFFRQGLEVKTECDMVDARGVIRPDRVVAAPDATWVIDFKTGQDLGEEHDRQLRRYCAAIAEMGYPAVEGWLIYLDDDIRVRRAV